MLCQVFFLVLLITASNGWILEVSESDVARKISSNVTLNCEDDAGNNTSKLSQIYEIRISKFNKNNQWDIIAKISVLIPVVQTSLTDADVTGNAGTPSKSFLKIIFHIVTQDTIGQFQCEIDGVGENGNPMSITTQPALIRERSANYDDILALVQELKEEEKRHRTKDQLQITILKNSIISLEKKEETLSTEVVTLKEKIVNQNQIMNKMAAVFRYDPSVVWPAGTYAILKAELGCPNSPTFDWLNGSFSIATKPAVNNDSTSNPSHMADTILQHDNVTSYNYVNMELCVKDSEFEAPSWPAGQYCIQSYQGRSDNVDKKFGYSYVQFDRYKTGSVDRIVNLKDYSRSEGSTMIWFWCRRDGDANTPINLPSKDAFYLYRYAGGCQRVSGMDVREEWVHFDTIGTLQKFNSFHPDVNTDEGVRFELCYYTPRL